jgi:hypothetical protein
MFKPVIGVDVASEIEVDGHVKILRPGDAEPVIGVVVATPGFRFPNGRVAEVFEIRTVDGRGDVIHYRLADEIEVATEDEAKGADPDAYVKCVGCEEYIEVDVDDYTYTSDGEVLCYGCEESEGQYASTVLVRDPEGLVKVLVTDHHVRDAEYFEDFTDIKITRGWKSSGGYRGYYETSLEGFTEITSGWTTGMPDDTVTRKMDFNDWAERLMDTEFESPFPFRVAVVCDPTSNVFSTAIGVWVEDDRAEEFKDLIGDEEFDSLHAALG